MSSQSVIKLEVPDITAILRPLVDALNGAPIVTEHDGSRWIEVDWLQAKLIEIIKAEIKPVSAGTA